MSNGFYGSFQLVFMASSIFGTLPYKYNVVDVTNNVLSIDPSKIWTPRIWKCWQQKLTVIWTVSLILSCAYSMHMLAVQYNFDLEDSEMLIQRGNAMGSSLLFQVTVFGITMTISFILCLLTFYRVPRIIATLRTLEEFAITQILYETRRYYPVVSVTIRHLNYVHRGLSAMSCRRFSILYQLPILLLVISAAQNIASALFTLFVLTGWDVAMHEVTCVAANVIRLAIVFIPLSLTSQKVDAALKYLSLINNACLTADCSIEMSLGIVSYLLIMLQYNKTVT
ncbi:unnamed protein product [Bemisia tabaci]|uniref:Uncharacterized protein n=1 Tax=Bemisia tabaci TaxID=7038 RepID=A0A9P0F1K3_BEMTA|nr:unnamed protein product [Bemisia tabaci]